MHEPTMRNVVLEGIRPIMFDRYAGDNVTDLPVEQKFYFAEDGESLVLPAANIYSMLGAENSRSAAKMFGGKVWRNLAAALCGFLMVDPDPVPILAKKKPLKFNGFGTDTPFYAIEAVPRLAKGIPNPKTRPVIRLPWSLKFKLTIFPNDMFNETLLLSLVEKAGLAIGLGSYRGVYGKFQVKEWK